MFQRAILVLSLAILPIACGRSGNSTTPSPPPVVTAPLPAGGALIAVPNAAGGEDLWALDRAGGGAQQIAANEGRTITWADDTVRRGAFVYAVSPSPSGTQQAIVQADSIAPPRVVFKLPAGSRFEPQVSPSGRFVHALIDAAFGIEVYAVDLDAPGAPSLLGSLPETAADDLQWPDGLTWTGDSLLMSRSLPMFGPELYFVDPAGGAASRIDFTIYNVQLAQSARLVEPDGEQVLVLTDIPGTIGYAIFLLDSSGQTTDLGTYTDLAGTNGSITFAGDHLVEIESRYAPFTATTARAIRRDGSGRTTLGVFDGIQMDLRDDSTISGSVVLSVDRPSPFMPLPSNLWSMPVDGSGPPIDLTGDTARVDQVRVARGRDGSAGIVYSRQGTPSEFFFATVGAANSATLLLTLPANAELVPGETSTNVVLFQREQNVPGVGTVTDFFSVEPAAGGPVVRQLTTHVEFADNPANKPSPSAATLVGGRFVYLRGAAVCSFDPFELNSEVVMGLLPDGDDVDIFPNQSLTFLMTSAGELFSARVELTGTVHQLTQFGASSTREIEVHQGWPGAWFSVTENAVRTLWAADPVGGMPNRVFPNATNTRVLTVY